MHGKGHWNSELVKHRLAPVWHLLLQAYMQLGAESDLMVQVRCWTAMAAAPIAQAVHPMPHNEQQHPVPLQCRC